MLVMYYLFGNQIPIFSFLFVFSILPKHFFFVSKSWHGRVLEGLNKSANELLS